MTDALRALPAPPLTLREVAEHLSCSVRTVEREIGAGRLPIIRVRGLRRVDPADLAAYIAQSRAAILVRAGHACEGSPRFPDCRARNGDPHPVTGSRVVLTIAHLDHVPENCEPENLRAWCQRCHNTYDAPMRAAGRRERAA